MFIVQQHRSRKIQFQSITQI